MHTHGRVGPATRGRTISWARLYDVTAWLALRGRPRRVREQLVTLAEVGPGDRVLDVGCGTGALALVAATRVGADGAVSGLDASPAMIEALRRKAVRRGLRVDARVGVAEQLPYDLASFTVVLSALVLHHLPADVQPVALAEMARVLRPDGRLLVADLAPPETGRIGGLLRRLARAHAANVRGQRLRTLVEDAGFVDVETGRSAHHPWLAYVRARKPRLGQVT